MSVFFKRKFILLLFIKFELLYGQQADLPQELIWV